MTRVFIHGLESTSQGTKGTYFRQRYPDMILADFTGDLTARMAQLEALLAGKSDLILVGSSFGGLMAALFAVRHPERVVKLVLLAPALCLADFSPPVAGPLAMPVVLYHGSADTVVAPAPARAVAEALFASLSYRLVGDDHSLAATFEAMPWDDLLAQPVRSS